MTKPIRVSIDFETTAMCAEAGILTFGAVVIANDPLHAEFYQKASLASNEKLGRAIDRETMEWWDKQGPELRADTFNGTQSLTTVLTKFEEWCKELAPLDKIELWSRGAGFDCEILEHAYLNIFGHYPFDFRKHMCQRTVQSLMPLALQAAVVPNPVKHNSLEDARLQARMLEAAFNNMNWSGWSE